MLLLYPTGRPTVLVGWQARLLPVTYLGHAAYEAPGGVEKCVTCIIPHQHWSSQKKQKKNCTCIALELMS